jgi:hypothetical protein
MTDVDTNNQSPAFHLMLAVAGMACTGLGTVSVLHGLRLVSADWLQPNPDVPAPVFVLVGLVMLLAAVLITGRLTSLPGGFINFTGYSVFGLSLVLAHWLVFLSDGGRCVLSAYGGSMEMSHMLCEGVFGSILALTDLVIIAIAASRLLPRMVN